MTDKRNHASTGDKSKPSMGQFLGSFQRQVVDKAERVFCSLNEKLTSGYSLANVTLENTDGVR